MRLIEFQPRGYRNLRNLPVVFTWEPEEQPDTECSIRFLVGVNGTGKSNLLRFLAAIFTALDEDYRHRSPANPAYGTPFRLVYQLRGNTITLESTGAGRSGIQFTVNEEAYSPGDLPGDDLILPRALMIFTSGDVSPWRNLLTPSSWQDEEGEELEELPDELLPDEEVAPGEGEIEQVGASGRTDSDLEDERLYTGPERVFLVEPYHLPLALLTALIRYQAGADSGNGADLRTSLVQVDVERLVGFSLRIAFEPDRLTPPQRELLSGLYRNATLPLAQGNTQLWVFDLEQVLDGEPLHTHLASGLMRRPFQFFRNMVALQQDGILREVNLVVAKRDPLGNQHRDRILLAENLSDGELAFLQRMALIHLLKESECLFLFDEAEVHFNDTWRCDLVSQIESTLAGTNSEIILTTHASITLTDAYPDEVVLLTHHGQEQVPLTFGAEPGELLRAVFGAERSVGRRAVRDIMRALQDGSMEELQALLDQVGPGYFRFKIVEEMQRRVSSYSQA